MRQDDDLLLSLAGHWLPAAADAQGGWGAPAPPKTNNYTQNIVAKTLIYH